MEDKLLRYQLPHFFQLEEILKFRNCALDASDTGTGKTYVAIALAHSLGKKPFIMSPKSVIPSWISVAKTLGVELFGIANYELIKINKYYTPKLEKVDCPYIDRYKILDPTDKNKDDSKRRTVEDFRFSLPDDVIVILDEAHRCKNHKSITSRLMLSIFRSGCKILLLSATIADKIECFKPFGVVFGFYDDVKKFNMWIRKLKKSRQLYYRNKGLTSDQITLDIIHSNIFPEDGSRMRIKDLGSMFPANQVLSQSYLSADQEDIQEQYDLIKEAFKDLKAKETRSAGLGKLVSARMKIEMLKVPIMLDIINEALDSNYSVAVFVNYKETMDHLSHYLNTSCLIHGKQTLADRQDSINSFTDNKSKIIICNTRAGGVGISLHDIHGGHPRMSVISPTWSGQDTQQALGRIHRAGSKSPALQRIVFVANTYEETICQIIQKKLTNISSINDRDLLGPQFTEEAFEEVQKDMDTLNYGYADDAPSNTNNDNKPKETKTKKNISKRIKKTIDIRTDNTVNDQNDAEVNNQDLNITTKKDCSEKSKTKKSVKHDQLIIEDDNESINSTNSTQKSDNDGKNDTLSIRVDDKKQVKPRIVDKKYKKVYVKKNPLKPRAK